LETVNRSVSPTLRSPHLWPLAVLLSAILWIIATSGGGQLFVKEVLGDAFDSQAEHFVKGNVSVDVEAIRPEAILINGEARMYFGPFPAFLRLPLNAIHPARRGAWSRLSGFCAGEIALIAFAGLVGTALKNSGLGSRAREWIGNASLIGFVFASPLLFLIGNLSIYNEAIIWGFAWSTAALFFLERIRNRSDRGGVWSLFGFSFCATCALLSRATFALPFLLIAPLLILQWPRIGRVKAAAALLSPLAAGLAFYLFLSYARFGTWAGIDYYHYINPVHREFVAAHGMFSVTRIPCSFADYFTFHFPSVSARPPLLTGGRHPVGCESLYSLPFSENFLSITWASSWLIAGALAGIVFLIKRGTGRLLERWTAAALFVQFLLILTHFALAQRYSAELYPLLIFCCVIFLRHARSVILPTAMIVLVAASSFINFETTATWISDDGALPIETRMFWSRLAGKPQPRT
jgi:hypothetical protein